MILRTIEIPWHKGDHGPWVVKPLGDIQWAGDEKDIALTHLQEDIRYALSYDETEYGTGHTWFLGQGDYSDFASPSNRQRLSGAALYSTAQKILDQKALDLNDSLVDVALRPTRGKWLSLLSGHHWANLKHGDISDMRLAQNLDAPHGGVLSVNVIRLLFKLKNSSQAHQIVLWSHHGAGNGQTGYYPLMRLEKIHMEWEGIHAYFIGHTTKSGFIRKNRVGPRWETTPPKLGHRPVALIGTGGYSKSYIEEHTEGQVLIGTYAEQALMNPSVIGSPMLKIWPRVVVKEGVQTWDPILRVEQ